MRFVILNCQYEILKCLHKAMAFFCFVFTIPACFTAGLTAHFPKVQLRADLK